jgi:hypothetical protein
VERGHAQPGPDLKTSTRHRGWRRSICWRHPRGLGLDAHGSRYRAGSILGGAGRGRRYCFTLATGRPLVEWRPRHRRRFRAGSAARLHGGDHCGHRGLKDVLHAQDILKAASRHGHSRRRTRAWDRAEPGRPWIEILAHPVAFPLHLEQGIDDAQPR